MSTRIARFRWRRIGVGIALASAVLAIALPAEAQRMDLALSRLRMGTEGAPCDPGAQQLCAPGLECVAGACVDPAPGDGLPGPDCERAFFGGERDYCADDDAWRRLATQFAASMIPPVLLPAHTRGMRGIYVGIEGAITGIDSNEEYWARGTEGDTGGARNRFVDSVLAWSRLNVRKGLPFGFEIGTNVGFLVNTSYWTLGLEIRWSLLEGLRDRNASVYFPSLSVRGAVQTLVGDSELNVTVPSIDVSLGERFIIADTVELSPYLGGQVAWVFADTELVDLTPERDAFAECNPEPMPAGGVPPFCSAGGDGTDFNHNAVFQSIRSMRARLFAGAQLRYEWFALTGAFAFDLLAPGELDDSLPSDLPRQWRVDLGVGVSY